MAWIQFFCKAIFVEWKYCNNIQALRHFATIWRYIWRALCRNDRWLLCWNNGSPVYQGNIYPLPETLKKTLVGRVMLTTCPFVHYKIYCYYSLINVMTLQTKMKTILPSGKSYKQLMEMSLATFSNWPAHQKYSPWI